jgi:flagellar hook protein FlgE
MGFQQGLSGLNTSAKALDVVGNNIANSQTVGYKSGQAQFADVFAASLNGSGSTPIGIGAKVGAVVQQFTQGNISVTNNPLDIAINGGGFFIMDDGSDGNLYARNGQFQLDQTGYIVNGQGLRLKGRLADSTGVIQPGNPTALRLFDPTQSLSGTPQSTGGSATATGVQANINLDSRLPAPTKMPFSYTDPTTYNQSTAVTIYDSLGNAHTYSLYFAKVPPSTGIVAVETASAGAIRLATDAALATEITAEAGGDTTAVGASAASQAVGDLAATLATDIAADPTVAAARISAFEADAKAAASAAATGAGQTSLAVSTALAAKAVAAALSEGASAAANKWNSYATLTNPSGAYPTFTDLSVGGTMTLGGTAVDYTTTLGNLTFGQTGTITSDTLTATLSSTQLGYPGAVDTPLTFDVNFGGSTQYGAPFAVNALIQDGFASGSLVGFNIGNDGTVLGRYTNGQTKAVGQVILASFRNPQGLQPLGNNTWAQAPASGNPILGDPGSSGQYGQLQSASLEDANVDLTAELVNMITLQRVYQANAQTIKTQDGILQTLVNLR